MARSNLNIIKVEGNFRNCPGDRLRHIINDYSDWEGTLQVCEHWHGSGEVYYNADLPLVIFHSEGDEKWIDIDYISQYGTLLHCNFILGKTKGKFFNYWAYDYLIQLKNFNQRVNSNNSFISKFLCLNGRPDWHRYYTLQRLVDAGLYDIGYVSFLNRYDRLYRSAEFNKFLESYNGKGSAEFVKNIFNNKEMLVLDKTNDEIHKNDRTHSPYLYDDTSISLVTETYPDSKRGLFITEKSYKPIANCHFQIWIAQPGMVEFFRQLGFDMFDDIIDNSYDNIVDDIERFEKALISLEKFLIDCNSFTVDKKQELQNRLTVNQTKYLNMKLSKEEIESWL
jgi:hypothetical protein